MWKWLAENAGKVLKGVLNSFGVGVSTYGAVKGTQMDQKNYELSKDTFEMQKANMEFQQGQSTEAMAMNREALDLQQAAHQHQVDQMNWTRDMHLQGWQREDQAVQRRVADLKAAGLSPVLAAGSAATASGPINVSSP